MELTHFDESGRARMVSVGGKTETERTAVARGRVKIQSETAALIREKRAAKGDVLAVAQLAGVMAAKKASDLIPLCHNIALTSVDVSLALAESSVEIEAEVRTFGRTGAEMEALTAVSVAALSVYDMCKSADRAMEIEAVRLIRKSGGKSGEWIRPGEDETA